MEDLDQKEIDRYWSDGAENYSWIIDDELNSFRVEKWREKILGNISSVRNPKILDAGCGPGFFTILLNQAGVETIGVDGAEKMLQEARAKALQAGLVPEFRRMDCHRLDFADNTFDAVISRNLTHTLRDHKQVYKEWLRVLKPGGTLFISHDLALVSNICDRIAVMYDGKIVESGMTDQIIHHSSSDYTKKLLQSVFFADQETMTRYERKKREKQKN